MCRRKPLLGYFGEAYEAESCGKCDNCLSEGVELVDLTIPAQKFLSCVVRTGEMFGASYIIDILRGSRAKRILSNGHDQLSTYDIGREYSKRQWQHLARQFVRQGILIQDPEHGGLRLSVAGRSVLQGETFQGEEPPKERIYRVNTGPQDEYDRALFALLREKRTELASEQSVPPYVIFSDRALAGMATIYPTAADQFTSISGIGRHKLENYGETFMAIIRAYVNENDIDPPEPQPPLLTSQPVERSTTRQNGSRTAQVVEALKSGHSLEEVATQFGITTSTVTNHLWMAVQAGETVEAGQIPLTSTLSAPTSIGSSTCSRSRDWSNVWSRSMKRSTVSYELTMIFDWRPSTTSLNIQRQRSPRQPSRMLPQSSSMRSDQLPGELPRSGLAGLL